MIDLVGVSLEDCLWSPNHACTFARKNTRAEVYGFFASRARVSFLPFCLAFGIICVGLSTLSGRVLDGVETFFFLLPRETRGAVGSKLLAYPFQPSKVALRLLPMEIIFTCVLLWATRPNAAGVCIVCIVVTLIFCLSHFCA